jgi:hypothetical protein
MVWPGDSWIYGGMRVRVDMVNMPANVSITIFEGRWGQLKTYNNKWNDSRDVSYNDGPDVTTLWVTTFDGTWNNTKIAVFFDV